MSAKAAFNAQIHLFFLLAIPEVQVPSSNAWDINRLTLQRALLSIALELDGYLESHLLLIGDIYELSLAPVTQVCL